MRYLVTMARDDDDERTDTANPEPTGLTLDGYEQLINALMVLGFDGIEVSGVRS